MKLLTHTNKFSIEFEASLSQQNVIFHLIVKFNEW